MLTAELDEAASALPAEERIELARRLIESVVCYCVVGSQWAGVAQRNRRLYPLRKRRLK